MAALLCAALSLPAAARGGGTDKNGCHRQTATNTRHCHNGNANKPKRSRSARNTFRRANPRPATVRRPGYYADHIAPLACGGADAPHNIRRLTAYANLSKGSMGYTYQ